MKLIVRQIESSLDISLPDTIIEQFNLYYNELYKWNRKVNLCGKLNPEIFWLKHVADSLLPYKIFEGHEKVADLGSGAGFPGLPLKIILPNVRMTLIDKNYKKLIFLEDLVRNLKLTDVKVKKYEVTISHDEKKYYDIILMRALKVSEAIARYISQVASGGCKLMIYNKPEDEAKVILSELGWQLRSEIESELPVYKHRRIITIFENVSRET